MKVLVSNPGKQYTHQLLLALQKYKIDFKFFTSFWFKPDKFPFNIISIFPSKLKAKITGQLKKRYDDSLEGKFVFQFPYFEILREFSDKLFGQKFSERMQFSRDRIHDKWVSSKLSNETDIIIGYEESSLLSFRKSKKQGITTVLDLAQVHYKEIESLSAQYPVFSNLFENKKLRNKINQIKKEELSLADYIICLSDYAKGTLVKEGFNSSKIFVANLGFDPAKFKAKENYSVSGKLKVVFVGTITRRKGIDVILQAHKELGEMIELIFVGPMADAKDLLDKHSLKYTWHSYLDHQRLNEIFHNADLFIFPSYLDSWAMVVIEAMACGLPVIVSENTGAKEAVIEGTGFVIPTGSVGDLKERIIYFYKNRDVLKSMGQNARKQALNYTWDVYHQKIDSIIHEVKRNETRR